MTSSPDPAPYQALAELAERELELVGEGRLAELEELNAERATLVARLPAVPPACAGEALERAALMQRRVMIEILRTRDAMLVELAKIEQARRTAHGYAPPRRGHPFLETSA
jgi:hypothetical protein